MTTKAASDDKRFVVETKDNGSSVILHEIDLRILKELQDRITLMAKFFYYTRRSDMKAQVVRATKEANPVYYDEAHRQTVHKGYVLREKDLIRIDPYMQYLKFVNENGKEV